MAAFLLAAALMVAPAIAYAASPEIPATPPIDTAAPVDKTQCAPCHLDLGDVNQPGLIFSHGNHLMVSCDACHSRMPHNPSGTETVPMEVCFACHGVQHGPQGELATSECLKCHTKSFELRPESHTKDYAGKPHADASRELGVNGCMMCHKAPEDCDACHEKKGLGIPKMPNAYANVLTDKPKPPSIKVFPDGPTTMAQCNYCHPDLDAITPGRLIFAHAAHLQRNYKCNVCHPSFGHSGSGSFKPDMLSCYRCHGLKHSRQGLVAGEDCGKCHPKGFDLVPKNHTAAFKKGKHKAMVDKNAEYCGMCHKPNFCVDCHNGRGTTPNASPQPVIPDDHRDASWQSKHGKLFLEKKGACGACHDGPSCQRCHKTPVPHPTNWIENHRPPAGTAASDCNVCHRDRGKCQACHHGSVKSAELIQKNCARGPGMKGCHVEMMQRPGTAIKNKGFAEHAVHFDVKKKKGHPYRCYECHTDFGSSAAAQKLEAQQGHDLRLCYSCHGTLDPFSVQIAPYKGSSLCFRCHTDLTF
ncbi:MAG: cytochrome c3 family protein [Coriobacteriia bacterium]|nr:cytochrome c3 family protein [Coriobacteriia bacterium]